LQSLPANKVLFYYSRKSKKSNKYFGLTLRTITLDLEKEESRERILSRNEMGLLVANAQTPLKHVILVALNTGMRKAEIYNLEWVNVNLEHNFITVTAQEAKNMKIRRIAINKSLRELLVKLNLIRNGNRYVFENPKTGKPYTDLKRRWRSALERSGINDMRFHDLRHTFASHLLMNGGDLFTLKEILDHKDITTTSWYLTITTEYKSKAMEIFAVPESESNIIELVG
jgi:integrase